MGSSELTLVQTHPTWFRVGCLVRPNKARKIFRIERTWDYILGGVKVGNATLMAADGTILVVGIKEVQPVCIDMEKFREKLKGSNATSSL
jgi:hypothetical protein